MKTYLRIIALLMALLTVAGMVVACAETSGETTTEADVAATVAPDVIEGLIKHPCVDSADVTFVKDFESLCGEGKTMLNCDK